METQTTAQWVSGGITEDDMGQMVKHLREKMLKLDIIQFCKHTAISPNRLVKWEEGNFESKIPMDKIGIGVLRKIALTFGLDVEIVITRKP